MSSATASERRDRVDRRVPARPAQARAATETPVPRAAAEPVAFEPEVYCRKRGKEYAAGGFAPCSAIGCQGCTPGG